MATCPYCGAQIDDGAKFCGICGAKMAATEVREIPEEPQIAPMPEPAEPAEVQPAPVPAAEIPEEFQTESVPAFEASAPVFSEPAAAQEERPVYAQPIYPEVQKKKSKKWLIPVIIVAALALIGIAILAFGGSGANDPNIGTYKATSVSMYDLDLNPDDIFDGGFIIQLEKNGKCHIQAGDTKGTGTWEVKDGVITINDGSSAIEGKLEDGVITVENMLDMGLNITLVKQDE